MHGGYAVIPGLSCATAAQRRDDTRHVSYYRVLAFGFGQRCGMMWDNEMVREIESRAMCGRSAQPGAALPARAWTAGAR